MYLPRVRCHELVTTACVFRYLVNIAEAAPRSREVELGLGTDALVLVRYDKEMSEWISWMFSSSGAHLRRAPRRPVLSAGPPTKGCDAHICCTKVLRRFQMSSQPSQPPPDRSRKFIWLTDDQTQSGFCFVEGWTSLVPVTYCDPPIELQAK